MFEFRFLSRLLTDILKQHPDSRLSRVLLRDLDAREDTASGTLTWADRLWRALTAAAASALCIGGAVSALSLSERFPDSSPSSMFFIGIGICAGMFGFVALVLAASDLVKTPFSPSSDTDPGSP